MQLTRIVSVDDHLAPFGLGGDGLNIRNGKSILIRTPVSIKSEKNDTVFGAALTREVWDRL